MNQIKELKLSVVLIFLFMLPVMATYFLKEDLDTTIPISEGVLSDLETNFRQQGIEYYFKEKSRLKKRVSRALSNNSSPSQTLAATNIAIYLFPDLLEDTHIEKHFAVEHFLPLQEQIEAQPGTVEARKYFETLRRTVWNYENPRSDELGLSLEAEKMLKLFSALTWN